MAGLTTTGISIQDIDTLIAELAAAQKAQIDADLNTEADSVVGQMNAIYAAKLIELWELFEEVYSSAYPSTATGQSLAYIAALTGTVKSPAVKATIECTIDLDIAPPVVLPAGTVIYVETDPDSRFELLADVNISTDPQADVVFTAETAGAATTIVNGDDLVIETPVTGWLSATYESSSLVAGSDEESDAELRSRRTLELARPGTATVDAIRQDILDNAAALVDTCSVFENASGITDSLGVPPFAIEVLVSGSFDADSLAQQIWDSKPAGTQTYGTTSNATPLDHAGNLQTVYYSTPISTPIYIDATVYRIPGSALTAADVEALITTSTFVNNIPLGASVYGSDIIEVIGESVEVEYVDITTVYVDLDGTPTTRNAILTSRQLATFSTANMTFTVSDI